MPNWCNNNIEVHGPIEKIKAMYNEAVQDADDETGLLNHMRPMPKELHDTTSPSDGPNWYDWRVTNWSTKWEVSSEGLEFYDNRDGTGSITGWFDSAWAPPTEACNFYAQENPDVSITLDYHEPGMCFVGQALFENGECMQDDCIDYSGCNHKNVRDVIGEAYDDNWNISEMMAEWADEDEDNVEA